MMMNEFLTLKILEVRRKGAKNVFLKSNIHFENILRTRGSEVSLQAAVADSESVGYFN